MLARALARRHRDLVHAALPGGVAGLKRALARDVGRIRERIAPGDADLEELERIQRDFLSRNGHRLVARAASGHVREGLGAPLTLRDVRAAGDALEIPRSADEESWPARDVCVDLASLALDLTEAGHGELAERLLSSFAAEADDFELYGVVGYYERQCAIERAAACASRCDARTWILLGLSTRRPFLLPPMIVAVGGLVASGKSTIARLVAEHMAAPRVEADRAREHLVPDDPLGGLEPGFADDVYEEMVRRAGVVLYSGRPVVLDACFPRRRQRDIARRLASEHGWPFLFIECRVDPDTAAARLAERDAAAGSEGWKRIHDVLARQWETTEDLPAEQRLVLDTARPVRDSEPQILERIHAAPAGHVLP